MLAIEDIHTYYGDSYVLHGVSLTVSTGSVVALLGRNGAGKTTTLKSIMGVVPPRKGQILLKGEPISRPEPEEPETPDGGERSSVPSSGADGIEPEPQPGT